MYIRSGPRADRAVYKKCWLLLCYTHRVVYIKYTKQMELSTHHYLTYRVVCSSSSYTITYKDIYLLVNHYCWELCYHNNSQLADNWHTWQFISILTLLTKNTWTLLENSYYICRSCGNQLSTPQCIINIATHPELQRTRWESWKHNLIDMMWIKMVAL